MRDGTPTLLEDPTMQRGGGGGVEHLPNREDPSLQGNVFTHPDVQATCVVADDIDLILHSNKKALQLSL